MGKDDIIETQGEVLSALPNANFLVKLDDNGEEILCYVSGRIRKNLIRILPGDRVMVSISTYDLTKGRITYRTKG